MRLAIPSRSRLFLAGGTLVALLLSLGSFSALRRWEGQSAQAAFRGAADERLHALEINFLDFSHTVERAEFARFSARLIDHDGTIQALEWIPAERVESSEKAVPREALERSADSGKMAATATSSGFLLIRPCYRGGAVPPNKQARREALSGFVLVAWQNAIHPEPGTRPLIDRQADSIAAPPQPACAPSYRVSWSIKG